MLVVVIITDEDDCSVSDPDILRNEVDPFVAPEVVATDPPVPVNLRCIDLPDHLYNVNRYVDGLKALRPMDDDVIFVLVAGIPQHLVGPVPADESKVDAFFADILGDPNMQQQATPTNDNLVQSCTPNDEPMASGAYPPRRLVEVARGFGKNAVLGSICNEGFGTETGLIMRAVAERLRKGITQ